MGSFKLFSSARLKSSSSNNNNTNTNNNNQNPPGFRYEYSQSNSLELDHQSSPKTNTTISNHHSPNHSFSKWFKFNHSNHFKPSSSTNTPPTPTSSPNNRKLSIRSFALPIATSFSSTHPHQLDKVKDSKQPNLQLDSDIEQLISPISLHSHHSHSIPHPLNLPISSSSSHPSLADKHFHSDPLPSQSIIPDQHSLHTLPPDSPSDALPPAQHVKQPVPELSSRLSRKPLQLLSAKLRPARRQTADPPMLVHRPSTVSLAMPALPRPDSLEPDPRPSLRAVSSPATPVPTHSDPREGSFELRSFRNVRAPLDAPPPPAAPPSPRPSSIATSSRAASPSPRISAAAFREARAARSERASISSSHSDLLAPPPPHPDLRHARFQTAPLKALSDSGHGSPNFRPHPRFRPQPLIHQIPARQQALAQAPSIRTLTPLNDHDILVPPRPAFYGSRAPPRSLSADMGTAPTGYQAPRPQSTRLAFAHHKPAGSHASVRSLPVAPGTPRRTSVATSVHEQRQLAQWHSDEEDDSTPGPGPAAKSREEEDDEVPLSRLRKKSAGSARGCAAAETLARGRQQLQSLEPRAPLRPPGHVRRASGTSASSGESGRLRAPAVPPLPTRVSDGMMMVPVAGTGLARGNSPTASSSSGSGSGTWSMPHTPRDSTGNVCAVPGGLQKGRVMFSGAPNEAGGRAVGPRAQVGGCEGPTSGLVAQQRGIGGGSQTNERKSIKEEASTTVGSPVGSAVWPGVSVPVAVPVGGMPLGSPGSPVRIEELGVPAGVDAYLYAGLGEEQKFELHRRSQMMMQMMAAQAQAAVQMHALALSTTQAAGGPQTASWLGGPSVSGGSSDAGRGWGGRPGRSEMGVGTGVSSVGATSGSGAGWGAGAPGTSSGGGGGGSGLKKASAEWGAKNGN